jgi:hypothetical protein
LAGCCSDNANPGSFTQGSLTIAPPIKIVNSDSGPVKDNLKWFDVYPYNDGGTIMVKVIDANGRHFDIYIDNRGRTDGPIYMNGYPGDKRSVYIRDQDRFKAKIMTSLGDMWPILKNSGP